MDAEEHWTRLRELVDLEPVTGSSVGTGRGLRQACCVATRVLGMTGAAVSLVTADGPSGIVAASSHSSSETLELQYLFGEGPNWDAFTGRTPVLAGDLEREDRWPGYGAAMIERGHRAAFSFPLSSGPSRLGVLDVFRDSAGWLDGSAKEDALDLAEVATRILLEGVEEAGEGLIPNGVGEAFQSRFAVFQAQGMVMVQLGVTLPVALARLRAHAYVTDRTLGEVSRDVVSRRLTLERDDPGSPK